MSLVGKEKSTGSEVPWIRSKPNTYHEEIVIYCSLKESTLTIL